MLGTPVPGAAFAFYVIAAASAAPMIGAQVAYHAFGWTPTWIGVVILSAGSLAFAFLAAKSRTAAGRAQTAILHVLGWALLIGVILYENLHGFLAYGIGFLVGVAITIGLTLALDRVGRHDQSFLNNSPLRDTLTKIFSRTGIHLICHPFVTTAVQRSVFDPDDPTYINNTSTGVPSPYAPVEARRVSKWFPEYHYLAKAKITECVEYCLASAALPFGIVRAVEINRTQHVDGGVADNIPLFPLVEHLPQIDEVFVVALDAFDDDDNASAKCGMTPEGWSKIKRLDKVRIFDLPCGDWPLIDTPYKSSWPPKTIPLEPPAKFPKITFFYPRESLGNFLSGTLNFDGKYAARLIDLGYEDTIRRLDRMASAELGVCSVSKAMAARGSS
jgi:predicted acylesterase/phospholipase RssA